MFKARQNNAGWRIDYFLVSERVKDRIADSLIYSEVLGSDHCPVGLLFGQASDVEHAFGRQLTRLE